MDEFEENEAGERGVCNSKKKRQQREGCDCENVSIRKRDNIEGGSGF